MSLCIPATCARSPRASRANLGHAGARGSRQQGSQRNGCGELSTYLPVVLIMRQGEYILWLSRLPGARDSEFVARTSCCLVSDREESFRKLGDCLEDRTSRPIRRTGLRVDSTCALHILMITGQYPISVHRLKATAFQQPMIRACVSYLRAPTRRTERPTLVHSVDFRVRLTCILASRERVEVTGRT